MSQHAIAAGMNPGGTRVLHESGFEVEYLTLSGVEAPWCYVQRRARDYPDWAETPR